MPDRIPATDTAPATTGLRALVVDDEAPALAELVVPARAGTPGSARSGRRTSGADALKILRRPRLDVVFCDIKMPGLDGIDLARVLSQFASRPQIVFVTAYDEHAVDAFELEATDYVMKPVRAERLAEAVRRVVAARAPARAADPEATEDETIPVELGGVTRVRPALARSGTSRRTATTPACTPADVSHLVRIPLTTLEERWADAGFARIHRSTLVALPHVDEMRVDARAVRGAGRRRLAAGQPPAHPRAARAAHGPATGPRRRRRPADERDRAAGTARRVRVTSPRTGATRAARSSR